MSGARLSAGDAIALQECIAAGGVALFPADTVYGLACDPCSRAAVQRLYQLKGRPDGRPAAVMFFALEHALAALPELDPRTLAAARALLPGPVTLVIANPRNRFPLACEPAGGEPAGRREGRDGPARREGRESVPPPLGLRVPRWPAALAALGAVSVAVMQSSANRSGEPAVSSLARVPESIRRGVDLVLDGGGLPGVASTVIDLRGIGEDGGDAVAVLREGALGREEIAAALRAAGLAGASGR